MSFADLKEKWSDLGSRWNSFLESHTSESLAELVQKRSTSSGQGRIYSSSRADVLLHVCTHAQYTTAQVVNMLRQLRISSLPDVMLITLARQEAAESAS